LFSLNEFAYILLNWKPIGNSINTRSFTVECEEAYTQVVRQ